MWYITLVSVCKSESVTVHRCDRFGSVHHRDPHDCIKHTSFLLLSILTSTFPIATDILNIGSNDNDRKRRRSNTNGTSFCIDSGAAKSCCHDKSLFKTMRACAKLQFVRTASGELIEVSGIGTVVVRMIDYDGIWREIEVENVLYVPEVTGD